MTNLKTYKEKLASQLLDGRKRTVRIYGNGGAGKSSFARELIELVGEEQVTLLETDPYIIKGEYRSQLVPKDTPHQKVTACMPVAHELNSLERDIRALQAGLVLQTIDESWAPSKILRHDKAILLIEGMSVGFLPKDLFDLSICLRASSELELKRRLDRDVTQRGRDPKFVQETHASRRQQYETYYRPYEENADVIIHQTLTEQWVEERNV